VVRRLRVVALAAACAIAGACGSTPPSAHPGLSSQLVGAIARRVTVSSVVSGESACSDPGLVANALHITVVDQSSKPPRDVYVYSFRAKSWDASAATVDACQAAYAAGASDVRRLDLQPYRLIGRGWSQTLTEELKAALDEASRAGTP
jgi:hypothetical protein